MARRARPDLTAAHDRSIVHRDLKPENVIVTTDGQAKVPDLGLAKFVAAAPAASAATLTHVPTGATELGAVLGTAAYMAPEQALGCAVDQRDGVFAFGVLLYEMLSGQRPFHGATGTEIVAAILKDEPELLPESVPEYLRQVVGRCLQKAPEERFASAREVLETLRTQSVVADAAPAPPRRRRLPRRIALVAAAAVGTAVLGVAVLVIVRGRGATTAPAAEVEPRRILVVPFENMTGDPSLDAVGAWPPKRSVRVCSRSVMSSSRRLSSRRPPALRHRSPRPGARWRGSVAPAPWSRARATWPETPWRRAPGSRTRQRQGGQRPGSRQRVTRRPVAGGGGSPGAGQRCRRCPSQPDPRHFEPTAALRGVPRVRGGHGVLGVRLRGGEQALRAVVELEPECWMGYLRLATMLGTLGRTAEATALMAKVRKNEAKLDPAELLFLKLDESRIAGTTVESLACIAAQLGEKDRAVELLREGFARGLTVNPLIHRFMYLGALHGYPPYEELIKPRG